MDTEKLKGSVIKAVDANQAKLRDLALKIHANPEVAFQEKKAAEWLAQYLEDSGFAVERGICELETAFKAKYGQGKPVVAMLGEYDALPGLGHGCGHNLIGVAAAGAGVAAKAAIDQLGGSVLVIGTPAEEVWGGKCYMANRGAFNDLDAVIKIHPGVSDVVNTSDTNPGSLAAWPINVEFFGRASHAAVKPEGGINALDTMILAFSAINALRQHIESTARIHGIITDGGQAVNAIPSHTAASFLVRAETMNYLEELKQRVLNCLTGAAMATGARLEYKWGEGYYLPVLNNLTLASLFKSNLESLGRKVEPRSSSSPTAGRASTDFGNVSQLVPGASALVAIAKEGTLGHSPEMAGAAGSEAGIKGMLDGAKAMVLTVVDLLASPETLDKIKKEFQTNKGK